MMKRYSLVLILMLLVLLNMVIEKLAQAQSIPIPITNCQDLQDINNNLAGSYQLANDVDCSASGTWNNGFGFVPIGASVSHDVSTPVFTGVLDGAGYKINNLSINATATNSPASVGISTPLAIISTASGATIENLTVNNAFIQSAMGNPTAILAGQLQSNSRVENVHVQGRLAGSNFGDSGGITALLDHSTISRSSSNIDINGGAISNMNLGGLAGYAVASTIDQSYAEGIINVNLSAAGGLVGRAAAGTSISNSYSNVQINFPCSSSPNGGTAVGGIMGTSTNSNDVVISNSYAAGTMTPRPVGGMENSCLSNSAQMPRQPNFTGWDFNNIWQTQSGVRFPYLRWENRQYISDCPQLQAISQNPGGNYFLAHDIECRDTVHWNNGSGFIPIKGFTGSLDGSTYTIKDLYINSPNASHYEGLLGHGRGASIKNLSFKNATISGQGFLGILAGKLNDSTIQNVHVQGTIRAGNGTVSGGITGLLSASSISRSSANMELAGGNNETGGLAGDVENSNIDQSYSQGSIYSNSITGGLVGEMNVDNGEASITNSYSEAQINFNCPVQGSSSGAGVGGLVGDSYSVSSYSINNSFAAGRIIASGINCAPYTLGGLVGHAASKPIVTNSYWDTQVTGQTTSTGSPSTAGEITRVMYTQAGYSGFDPAIWRLQVGDGDDYTPLQWQPVQLFLNLNGHGSGTIVSSPGGLNCTVSEGASHGICSALFPVNQPVILGFISNNDFSVTDWGGCAAVNTASCTITPDQNLAVNIAMNPRSTVSP